MKRGGRDRVLAGLAVVGVVVAVATLLFSGLVQFVFQLGTVPSLLEGVASLLPVVGVVLVLAVVREIRKHNRDGRSEDRFASRDVEQVGRKRDRVGRDLDRRLRNGASDWYRCEATYSVTDTQERLEESAIRVVKTSEGLDETSAREAIEYGTWTGDPVAGAFLSPHRSQPLKERLRGVLDPGRAYRRRVDRTIAAIEAHEEYDTPRREPETTDIEDTQQVEVAVR